FPTRRSSDLGDITAWPPVNLRFLRRLRFSISARSSWDRPRAFLSAWVRLPRVTRCAFTVSSPQCKYVSLSLQPRQLPVYQPGVNYWLRWETPWRQPASRNESPAHHGRKYLA